MSDCLDTGVVLLSQHYRVTNDTRYVVGLYASKYVVFYSVEFDSIVFLIYGKYE